MKKNNSKQKQGGFLGKIIVPVVLIFIVVGFIYWGSDESNKTSKNPIAKGVAKFYSEVRQAFKPGAERLNEYTIKLPESDVSVTQQLASLEGAVDQPAKENWQGDSVKRSFKQNETLKGALQAFAKKEGMELIWDLKYDYIIKEHFVETSNLRTLTNKISSVVNSDYSGQVKTYFCKDARALVITDKTDSYIEKNCKPTK